MLESLIPNDPDPELHAKLHGKWQQAPEWLILERKICQTTDAIDTITVQKPQWYTQSLKEKEMGLTIKNLVVFCDTR